MIYFIVDPQSNLVKIGTTNDLSSAFRAIKRGNGNDLYIAKTIPGSYSEENRLHKQYAHLRGNREWFKFEGELKEFIEGKINQQDIDNLFSVVSKKSSAIVPVSKTAIALSDTRSPVKTSQENYYDHIFIYFCLIIILAIILL